MTKDDDTEWQWLPLWLQSSNGRQLEITGDREIEIAPEEWAVMLEEARAPKPWRVANAPERFAASIAFRWPTMATTRERSPYGRATEAIAELRRLLPKIVADSERRLAALDDPPAEIETGVMRARSAATRELDKLRLLLAALPELTWERSHSRKSVRSQTEALHIDAVRLFRLYQRNVDRDAGKSDDGPAVRFINAALKRMGLRLSHLNSPGAAISKALKRFPKRGAFARPRRGTKRR